ncbi:MAG: hypothetical protein J0M17_23330, partial [Planctomycetes bacterium]|nr:hypothetical protein [Planctomycetota bacterium]
MSQPDLTSGGIYEERPRSNIYTAMLGIAFLALCAASALLAMELQAYDFDAKAATKVSVPTVAPVRTPEPTVDETSTDAG